MKEKNIGISIISLLTQKKTTFKIKIYLFFKYMDILFLYRKKYIEKSLKVLIYITRISAGIIIVPKIKTQK